MRSNSESIFPVIMEVMNMVAMKAKIRITVLRQVDGVVDDQYHDYDVPSSTPCIPRVQHRKAVLTPLYSRFVVSIMHPAVYSAERVTFVVPRFDRAQPRNHICSVRDGFVSLHAVVLHCTFTFGPV